MAKQALTLVTDVASTTREPVREALAQAIQKVADTAEAQRLNLEAQARAAEMRTAAFLDVEAATATEADAKGSVAKLFAESIRSGDGSLPPGLGDAQARLREAQNRYDLLLNVQAELEAEQRSLETPAFIHRDAVKGLVAQVLRAAPVVAEVFARHDRVRAEANRLHLLLDLIDRHDGIPPAWGDWRSPNTLDGLPNLDAWRAALAELSINPDAVLPGADDPGPAQPRTNAA